MKRSILFAAGAVALAGAAFAAPISADTSACMAAVETAMETNTLYDAFLPTKFLDEARVVDWKAPYSDTDATPVATLVMIEGVARQKMHHDDTDDVTVKCGMDMGVVKGIEIIPGHDAKMKSPMTTN
jgi:hypothetical protein